MTKKKIFVKRSTRFILWLSKACIVTYVIISIAIVASISTWQGTAILVKEFGLLGVLPVLGGFGMILHFICAEQQSKQEEAKVERSEAVPDKPESRWRRNAPATLTDVPLEEWSIGALTILRQIEIAFDSKHVYENTTCESILRAMEPTRRGSYLFVGDNDPVALREFIRNGGVAKEHKIVSFSSIHPSEIKLAGYRVGFYVAKTDDKLADLARSIRSEAQAEIDRRALENKKETHRD